MPKTGHASQVQELQAQLDSAEASSASQPAQQDMDKLDDLMKANQHFEDLVASLELELEQAQQQLEQAQQAPKPWEEECVAKALQVCPQSCCLCECYGVASWVTLQSAVPHCILLCWLCYTVPTQHLLCAMCHTAACCAC